VTLKIECVVDGGMDAEEALSRASCLEPLHLALASSHRLMGVLGAIVRPHSLLMRADQAKMPERRSVGAELVGGQQFRGEAQFPQQLAHQPERRPPVTSALKGPRPHDRRHATGISACRRSGSSSRRDTIARSGVGGAAAGCARSGGRISAPSAALFRTTYRARARRVAPRRRGSSG